jgi:hypothetical protein
LRAHPARAANSTAILSGAIIWCRGYAYVAQNKGTLNLKATTAADPTACRLNPALGKDTFVHFYDDDSGMPFTRSAPFNADAPAVKREAEEDWR